MEKEKFYKMLNNKEYEELEKELKNEYNGNLEKLKIVREGLRNYPDSKMLNNQLLFYLENDEKEQHYKELEKKGILNVPSVMEMISYYF